MKWMKTWEHMDENMDIMVVEQETTLDYST